jgi:hypothetical protein
VFRQVEKTHSERFNLTRFRKVKIMSTETCASRCTSSRHIKLAYACHPTMRNPYVPLPLSPCLL